MWSREVRFGLGGWLAGTGLVYFVPAAQYFGFHIDQRAQAVIFVVSFVILLVGAALMVHALLPGRKKEDEVSKKKKPPSGGAESPTFHGPVGSYKQKGGVTKQTIHYHGDPKRTLAGADLTGCETTLRRHQGTSIEFSWVNEPEPQGFASEIRTLILACGWDISRQSAVITPEPPSGVAAHIPAGTDAPVAAALRALIACLTALGFPARVEHASLAQAANTSSLLVGRNA